MPRSDVCGFWALGFGGVFNERRAQEGCWWPGLVCGSGGEREQVKVWQTRSLERASRLGDLAEFSADVNRVW